MSANLRITIDGEDIRPETVPLRDLLALLNSFHAALTATASDQGIPKDEIHVSLIGVEDGSDSLVLSADEKTHRCAQSVVEAIEKQDPTAIPRKARRALHDIWKRAESKSWTVRIDRHKVAGKTTATIDPKRELFGSPITSGDTSLLVYLIRAGGENPPTVKFRLADKQELTATVAGQDLCQKLGEHLFQFVQIDGKATWNTTTWELLSFQVTALGSYQERLSDPVNALTQLSSESQGNWDDIDPTEFIREIRSD